MHIASFLNPGTLSIICVLGGPILVAILYILSKSLENTVRHWREVSLKCRMIDAGMSAAEIEQVVTAGQRGQTPKTAKPVGKYAA